MNKRCSNSYLADDTLGKYCRWSEFIAVHEVENSLLHAIYDRNFGVFLVTAIIKIVIDDINILWVLNDPWNEWTTNEIDIKP